MLHQFNGRVFAASLLQLGLLAGFYGAPVNRVAAGVYMVLFVANSGLLLFLAYQAFLRLRPIVATLAALLAFPGLVMMVIAVVFWEQKL
jgi:ABC-type dipeptide/oligopeptide/nickel transport system permease subunit